MWNLLLQEIKSHTGIFHTYQQHFGTVLDPGWSFWSSFSSETCEMPDSFGEDIWP